MVTDPILDTILLLLYSPSEWSQYANGCIYDFVGFVLQTSKAYNITIDGGAKYHVPPEEIAIDTSSLGGTGDTSSQNLTSYTMAAIAGVDNFSDGILTIKEVFDIIVDTTREVTPACRFFSFTCICSLYLPGLNQVGTVLSLGCTRSKRWLRIC